MHERLGEVVVQLSSTDLDVVEDSCVKAGLILEADARGRWDEKTIVFYPHLGLYDRLYPEADITGFIERIGKILMDGSIPFERKQNLEWALSKSQCRQACDVLIAFVKHPSFADNMERSAVLLVLRDWAEISPEMILSSGHLPGLNEKLRGLHIKDTQLERIKLTYSRRR